MNQHIYSNDRVVEFRMVTDITILKTPNILQIDGRFDIWFFCMIIDDFLVIVVKLIIPLSFKIWNKVQPIFRAFRLPTNSFSSILYHHAQLQEPRFVRSNVELFHFQALKICFTVIGLPNSLFLAMFWYVS